MAAFAERLDAELRLRGMTQSDLARETGLTRTAVSRYVSGQREPRAITVAQIARALGVTPNELLGTEGASQDEVENAVRLIARNANSMSDEQREKLISALLQR